MNSRKTSFLLASLVLTGIALAAEHTQMAIAVIDEQAGADVEFQIDSDELGFKLHDMQEGENRSIVDESGRMILVTREADGFRFDVDGRTVSVPLFDGEHHGAVWVANSDATDVDVQVPGDVSVAAAHPIDGVMIVSRKPIDDTTKQAITSLLQSAGHGSEVRFIEASEHHGGLHGIKVIEKKIEITN